MKSNSKNRTIVEAPMIGSLYGDVPVPTSFNARIPQSRFTNGRMTPRISSDIFHRASFDEIGSGDHGNGLFERADSILSLDSEVSATSTSRTKGSSTLGGSTSDVSTVCGDSDTEEKTSTKLISPSSHSLNKDVDSDEIKNNVNKSNENGTCDNDKPQKMCGNESYIESTSSQGKHKINTENCESEKDNSDVDSDSEMSPKKTDSHSESESVHLVSKKLSEVLSPEKLTLLELSQQTGEESHTEDVVSSVHLSSTTEAPVKSVKPQPIAGRKERIHTVSTSSSNDEDRGSIGKKHHKRANMHHHYIHPVMMSSNKEVTSQVSSGEQSTYKQPKVFNPFPSQHINRRRAENGVKLGLYSADHIPKVEVGMVKTGIPKQLGRAQMNMCLHRQYMANVRQSAKSLDKQ
jgi:hypothetical protein